MDINNIQALIAQGLLTDVASVDPNKAYVAVGVFQPGNRQSGPAGNAYPSYAMPISEFLAAGGVYTASNGIALVGNDFQLASQNISQFINDAGYITSVTPQDLQSVVTAGNVLTSFNLVQSPDGNNKIDIDNNNLRLRRFVPGSKFSYVLVNNTNVEITNLDFASGKTGSLTVDPLGGNILDNSVKNTFTAPVHLFNTGNVGIAVTPTDTRLHVKGSVTLTDFTFKAEDAGGNPLLYVRNDGYTTIMDMVVGRGGGLISTNTVLGVAAIANATGGQNTGVGYAVLNTLNTGTGNTAIGYAVLANITSGTANVGIGASVMQASNPSYSIGIGSGVLYQSSGTGNTGIGHGNFYNLSLGDYNTALGYNAGANVMHTQGNNNLFLGYMADVSTNNLTNASAIGANATVGASNSMVLGNGVNVGIGSSTPTSKLQVVGLPTYADNTAASGAGLTVGAMYIRTGHGLDIVV